MEHGTNPYSPGAGRKPTELVGRDQTLDRWKSSLQRIENGRDARSFCLYGLRGVGKTVLLAEFSREAKKHEWIVVKFEAGAGQTLRERLSLELHQVLADFARPGAKERMLKAFKTLASFKTTFDPNSGNFSFGIDLSDQPGGGADSGNLESDMFKLVHDVSSAAQDLGLGFTLLVDEAQDLEEEELAVLAAVTHRAGQEGWAFLAAVAGLPSLPRLFSEAKSYTERLFDYHEIRELPLDDARLALTSPAASEGIGWEDSARDYVINAASGYPYYIQQFGHDSWIAADSGPISLQDAQQGVEFGQRELDGGFFRSRWDRATTKEKEYLRAVAAEGNNSAMSSEVASRMGRKIESLGPARANLISKGIIYAPEHGVVAFTVPGMVEFINRQTDE